MVWLLMAAAVMGGMLVAPCSKLWYASAIASPGTPFSAHQSWTAMTIHDTQHRGRVMVTVRVCIRVGSCMRQPKPNVDLLAASAAALLQCHMQAGMTAGEPNMPRCHVTGQYLQRGNTVASVLAQR
jgi:hypothetical protein